MARTRPATAHVSPEDRPLRSRSRPPEKRKERRRHPMTNPGTRLHREFLSDPVVKYYGTSRLWYVSRKPVFRPPRTRRRDNGPRPPESGRASCHRPWTTAIALAP